MNPVASMSIAELMVELMTVEKGSAREQEINDELQKRGFVELKGTP